MNRHFTILRYYARLFLSAVVSFASFTSTLGAELTNLTPRCSEVEASYTAAWNYLYAIYDGTTGFGELSNGQTWASWSENRPASQWLRYGWSTPQTVEQTRVWFWTDTQQAGDHVHVPSSWKVQYLDETSATWKDVVLAEGESYTCSRTAVNAVSFEPVNTRQLRLVMQAATNGTTYSALGVTEWEVLGRNDEVEGSYGDYPIQNVDFSRVHLTDHFWLPRMEQNQTVTIPIALKQCYDTGRVLNFQKAAAILRGENIGYFATEYTFDDTDIYKILEGMAYSVQTKPNAELDAKMDELIAIIGAAQEPDGYLYTARTAGRPGAMHAWVGAQRWIKDPDLSHELYNCGHLYEAAAAHYISTGKRSLLDIAIKNADLLVKDFLEGGLTYEPGHQIVEMGLVKMYRVTGNEDYLRLARYFLDLRGLRGVMRQEYSQTHKPVVMQNEAVGHAVRAAYMFSGMADVAAIMNDEAYLAAIDRLWENVVSRKLYITGGIGAQHSGESFGPDYVLPNREAYCETCAAIANVYWNWRMFLLHGESKYYDVIERTLYNGLISGISLSGDHFFYPNPLASDGNGYNGRSAEREEWFGCACCPSNLCRFTASVPGYIYAHKGQDLYVNLYIQGTGDIELERGSVQLTQTTEMPWGGAVSIHVEKNTAGDFALRLRLPGWAQGRPVPSDLYNYIEGTKNEAIHVFVNQQEVTYELLDGYMTIERSWKEGDIISFELPMNVHKTLANANVEADKGLVALERGPVVYCLEWPDNDNLSSCYITDEAVAEPMWTEELNGLMTLQVTGQNAHAASTTLTAIPYYAWANRGKGAMAVWIPREGPQPYVFNAKDWTTGDANRIQASAISYDEERNVLLARSSGNHNICLTLKYQDLNYDIAKDQKYLVVRGTNLSTTTTKSYLWWLNGVNRGTSVTPVVHRSITLADGSQQIVIAWNLAQSGLYETFNSDYPNVCQGQTIFGLTSTSSDGSCEIHDIMFVENVTEYMLTLTGVGEVFSDSAESTSPAFDLSGRPVRASSRGFHILRNKKWFTK